MRLMQVHVRRRRPGITTISPRCSSYPGHDREENRSDHDAEMGAEGGEVHRGSEVGAGTKCPHLHLRQQPPRQPEDDGPRRKEQEHVGDDQLAGRVIGGASGERCHRDGQEPGECDSGQLQ